MLSFQQKFEKFSKLSSKEPIKMTNQKMWLPTFLNQLTIILNDQSCAFLQKLIIPIRATKTEKDKGEQKKIQVNSVRKTGVWDNGYSSTNYYRICISGILCSFTEESVSLKTFYL